MTDVPFPSPARPMAGAGLSRMPGFSRTGHIEKRQIEQLGYGGYSPDQAAYGATAGAGV